MARGRMISATLGESRKYAALSTDIARVLYPLIVANTDKGGRIEADPVYITRKVCTRLPYDHAQVELALDDMANVGLIILYEHAGVPYLQVVKFRAHNTPHHKESDSEIPPPPGYAWDGTEIEEAEKPDTDDNSNDGGKQRASTTPSNGQARLKEPAKQAHKGIEGKGSRREVEGKKRTTPPTPPRNPDSPPASQPERDGIGELLNQNPMQTLKRASEAAHKTFERICRAKRVEYAVKIAQAEALNTAIDEHGAPAVEEALQDALEGIGDIRSVFRYVMSRLQNIPPETPDRSQMFDRIGQHCVTTDGREVQVTSLTIDGEAFSTNDGTVLPGEVQKWLS